MILSHLNLASVSASQQYPGIFLVMNISVAAFCQAMGFSDSLRFRLSPLWSELTAGYTTGSSPDYLTFEYFSKYYAYTAGPGCVLPFAAKVCNLLASNEHLRLYGHILHTGIFRTEPVIDYGLGQSIALINYADFPSLEGILGRLTGVFDLLIAVSALPLIEQKFRSLGIPVSYARGNALWLGSSICLDADGYPLHNLSQLNWLRHSVEGRLFRLGRLEYLLHPYPQWVPAIYRSGQNLAVLCRDGWLFDSAGRRAAVGDADTFSTSLTYTANSVTGTPIRPDGVALPCQPLTLDLNRWRPVAPAWSVLPSIHIPAGGGMRPELVKDSLRQAIAFFRSYFQLEIALFVCTSWIFNPAWEELLPESNLAHFARNVYLLPGWPPTGVEGLSNVFGRSDRDFASYPADTSLQQAFHRLFAAEQRLCSGGMFILSEDVESFGTEPYR